MSCLVRTTTTTGSSVIVRKKVYLYGCTHHSIFISCPGVTYARCVFFHSFFCSEAAYLFLKGKLLVRLSAPCETQSAHQWRKTKSYPALTVFLLRYPALTPNAPTHQPHTPIDPLPNAKRVVRPDPIADDGVLYAKNALKARRVEMRRVMGRRRDSVKVEGVALGRDV
jgi:hypothetical protein